MGVGYAPFIATVPLNVLAAQTSVLSSLFHAYLYDRLTCASFCLTGLVFLDFGQDPS